MKKYTARACILKPHLEGNEQGLREALDANHCALVFRSSLGFEFLSQKGDKFFVYNDGSVSKRN